MKPLNFKNMKFSIVRPGVKASGATVPQMILTPTINKFQLNGLASKILDLETGDYISIIESDSDDFNRRLFLTKGLGDINQAKLAATNNVPGIGRPLTFNYAGLWSRVLQGNPNAVEATPDSMVDIGLIVKNTGSSYTAKKKVIFSVGEVQEIEIDGIEEPIEVYPLTDMRFVDYTPRVIGGVEVYEEEDTAE